MKNTFILSEDQTDCLQEIMNIAYGSATAAISSILDSFATLNISKIKIIKASKLKETTVLCISKDLPFAQARFCGAEGLDKVITLSDFRSDFTKQYGVEIIDGPLQGLASRAIVVVNAEGKVIYTQQVPEIVDEPNYEEVLAILK